MPAVEWRHDGERPILAVRILPPGNTPSGGIAATALLDTGATTSGISHGIAKQLSLRTRGKRPLATAHSDDLVDRYFFRVGLHSNGSDPVTTLSYIFDTIEGFQIRDGFAFNAIIGMDVLRQCDFRVGRNGRCQLDFGYV